jgi:hypothetical protein
MPTKTQGKIFKDFILDSVPLLSESIDWINDNLKPEDVFDDIKLHQWAQENGYARPMVKPEEADSLLDKAP